MHYKKCCLLATAVCQIYLPIFTAPHSLTIQDYSGVSPHYGKCLRFIMIAKDSKTGWNKETVVTIPPTYLPDAHMDDIYKSFKKIQKDYQISLNYVGARNASLTLINIPPFKQATLKFFKEYKKLLEQERIDQIASISWMQSIIIILLGACFTNFIAKFDINRAWGILLIIVMLPTYIRLKKKEVDNELHKIKEFLTYFQENQDSMELILGHDNTR